MEESKTLEQQPQQRPVRGHGFRAGVLTGIVLAFAACALVVLGAQMAVRFRMTGGLLPTPAGSPASSGSDTASGITAKMAEIDQLINQYFIFDVDRQKMADRSLAGYVSGLDDVYSVYYTPEEFQDTMQDSNGSFVGIGVSVQQDPDTGEITVLTVYPDSPAAGGGMEKGDILAKVDGEDVSEWDLSDVVAKIRGEVGTQVTVTVRRGEELIDVTMTRASLDKITVESRMLEDGVGYVQLTEFDAVSAGQIEQAVKDLSDQGMQRMILDLRDNPGGLLTSVVEIADDLLPKADILYIDDKQGQRTTYDSKDGEIWEGPVVVLINGNSASAAEVLSGALKDNNRAILVGEQSFGKGIVQTFFSLSDGSGVKLTTADYCTPSGKNIHGVGIAPDLEVADDPDTEADEQLDAALEEVKRLN